MGIHRGSNERAFGALTACLPSAVILAMLALQNGVFYPSLIALAMLLHEAGHVLAARALKISLKLRRDFCPGFCFSYDADGTSYIKELAVCVGGAIVSAASAVCAIMMGCANQKGGLFFIIVSMSFACFNLLPCRYLDGGGMLRSLLHMLLPCYTADLLANIISDIFTVLALGGAIFAVVIFKGNFSLALIIVYLASCSIRDISARIAAQRNKRAKKYIKNQKNA